MPPPGRGSCEDWHNSLWLSETLSSSARSERGGCSLVLEFVTLSHRHPEFPKLSKSFEVLPLQEELRQQVGQLLQVWQKTIDRHRKHLSHILICFLDKTLQHRDLYLSFVMAQVQKIKDLQQESLQLESVGTECLMFLLLLVVTEQN